MSSPNEPVPVNVVPDKRPTEVIIISHSPLFYWWPVWAVGFLMAGMTWWQDERIAFVPAGTEAKKAVALEGMGVRDILVVPEGRSLPASSQTDELRQPRMRMSESNNPGIIWALTLCFVIVVTHVQMRGAWSLLVAGGLVFLTVLFAFLGLWDQILLPLRIIDIHINALGYLSISIFLFVIWLFMFFVVDRLKYMIFTRGRVRVRQVIGEGEKVFDTRGMVFKRHRDDMFRHWLLGFGTADLTVLTSGAIAQQIEMPNVLGVHHKLELINTMLQELEVVRGR